MYTVNVKTKAFRQEQFGGVISGPRNLLGLHQRIASHLGSMIGRGALSSGDLLPNEADLSTEFGVSRTVLREAMKVLASKGLVEVRRKTGTRVRPQAEWNLLDPEVLAWLFSEGRGPVGLLDLLEVRRLIEPASARMASERATPEDIEKIKTALESMQAAVDDLESSVQADLDFHLAVLTGAHNPFMLSFGALIRAALLASFCLTSQDRRAYRRTLKLHKAIVEAILARKPQAAEAAMIVVLDQTSADMEMQLTRGAKAQRKARP